MKTYIAWSGPQAKVIAEGFRELLPAVLQSLDLFLSEIDIGRGVDWLSKVMKELRSAQTAIICLTPENAHSEWLNFEAGGVSTNGPDARVFTYLHNVSYAEINQPLATFQHTLATREGTLRLIQDLRKILVGAPAESVVDKLFEKLWPEFEATLKRAHESNPAPRRAREDMVEETLELTRQIAKTQRQMKLFDVFKTFYGSKDAPARFDTWLKTLSAEDRDNLFEALADPSFSAVSD